MCLHTSTKKTKDLCPACDVNLYYDGAITQRVGLLAEDDYTIEGWMCPHCNAQFDLKNNLKTIDNSNISVGRA
jgi:Zn-finger nucleic acid-binding protein